MSFKRLREDFTCAHCGLSVTGNGYTDHCPACLWGRHVDTSPGDRSADCGEMMRPVDIVERKGGTRIAYVCEKCRHTFQVRRAKEDSDDAILALARAVVHERGV